MSGDASCSLFSFPVRYNAGLMIWTSFVKRLARVQSSSSGDREGFECVQQEFARRDAPFKRNTDDIAELEGLSLEEKYRDHARSYFS